MRSQDWLIERDVRRSLHKTGRLWQSRPDVDLRARGDVLEIRGKADRTMDLVCDVGLPMAFGLDQLETA